MKTKHFKSRHALLMSLTSLMLCVSMLFGATFAWFTDSVTSGVNRIVSGNLDVELTHTTGDPATPTTGNVDQNEKLFTLDFYGNPLRWEPEVMAYETFKVSNVGNLNLKYELHLNNVGENNLNGNKLADVIKVAVLEEDAFTGARPDASAFTSTLAQFVAGEAFRGDLKVTETTPDTEDTWTIVLYWPQSASDNDYNVNNGQKASDGKDYLYVDLGITLVATQETGEYDSFNNTYDETANLNDVDDSWAGVYITSASATSEAQTLSASSDTVLTAAATPANKANAATTVTIPASTGGETAYVTVDTTNDGFTLSGDGTTGTATSTIDVTLYKNNVKTDSSSNTLTNNYYTVETYITAGLTNVSVSYGTESWSQVTSLTAANQFTYESGTGKLVFTTSHFSEFKATGEGTAYIPSTDTAYQNFHEALEAAKDGKTVLLLKDVDLTNTQWTPIGTETEPFKGSFDGKGHTINGLRIDNSSMEAAGLFGYVQNGSLKNFNIKGASITANKKSGIVSGYANGACVFENISVDSTSSITGGSNVSGLVGYLQIGNKSFVEAYTAIKNCSVAATITGKNNESTRAAGFVGAMNGTRILHFENCTFSGTVNGPTRSSQFVGIAQSISDGNGIGSVSAVILDNCRANGTVTEGTENGVLIGWTQYVGRHIILNQFKINGAAVSGDDYAKLVGYSQCTAGYKNSITNVIQVDGKIVGFYQGSGDNSKNGNYQSVDAEAVYSYNANKYESSDSVNLNCDYTLCLNDDYTLTYKVNKMTLIHNKGIGLDKFTKFVGNNDNAELYITCKESGDNYSSSVDAGNFYNTNGEPITVFKTTYTGTDPANDNNEHTVGFKWNSTLNGWRLLDTYSTLYPATT